MADRARDGMVLGAVIRSSGGRLTGGWESVGGIASDQVSSSFTGVVPVEGMSEEAIEAVQGTLIVATTAKWIEDAFTAAWSDFPTFGFGVFNRLHQQLFEPASSMCTMLAEQLTQELSAEPDLWLRQLQSEGSKQFASQIAEVVQAGGCLDRMLESDVEAVRSLAAHLRDGLTERSAELDPSGPSDKITPAPDGAAGRTLEIDPGTPGGR